MGCYGIFWSGQIVEFHRNCDWFSLWAQLFEGRSALNPWVEFNPGFFFLYRKEFSRIIFSDIFRPSNHQIADKKNKTEMLFKLSNLNSNLALTLGHLNPALSNSALIGGECHLGFGSQSDRLTEPIGITCSHQQLKLDILLANKNKLQLLVNCLA